MNIKKILLLLLLAGVFVSCNKDLDRINSVNKPDTIKTKTLRTDILDFNDVTIRLARAGFINERIGDEFQDLLPCSCDTASLFVNYNEIEKFLIVGFDSENEYLHQAQADCDRVFTIRTERDGTVIFVRCEGSGNTCRVEEAENAGIVIVICSLSR